MVNYGGNTECRRSLKCLNISKNNYKKHNSNNQNNNFTEFLHNILGAYYYVWVVFSAHSEETSNTALILVQSQSPECVGPNSVRFTWWALWPLGAEPLISSCSYTLKLLATHKHDIIYHLRRRCHGIFMTTCTIHERRQNLNLLEFKWRNNMIKTSVRGDFWA